MTAYGDSPAYHRIEGERFVCTAPDDAKCRTSPTCECENWCCCDGSPEDAKDSHDDGEHCCMTTVKSGQGCWIEPWVDAVGVDECGDHNAFLHDDGGEVTVPDGPVTCDWDDGICWTYAVTTNPPASEASAGVGEGVDRG